MGLAMALFQKFRVLFSTLSLLVWYHEESCACDYNVINTKETPSMLILSDQRPSTPCVFTRYPLLGILLSHAIPVAHADPQLLLVIAHLSTRTVSLYHAKVRESSPLDLSQESDRLRPAGGVVNKTPADQVLQILAVLAGIMIVDVRIAEVEPRRNVLLKPHAGNHDQSDRTDVCRGESLGGILEGLVATTSDQLRRAPSWLVCSQSPIVVVSSICRVGGVCRAEVPEDRSWEDAEGVLVFRVQENVAGMHIAVHDLVSALWICRGSTFLHAVDTHDQ